MLKTNEKLFSRMQKALDSLAVSLAWIGSYHIRFNYISDAQSGLANEFYRITPFLVIMTLYFMHQHQLYQSLRFSSRYKEIFNLFKANSMTTLSLVIILYFVNQEKISRLTIVIYFIFSSFLLLALRISVRNFLRHVRKKGKNLRHLLLVGNSRLLLDYVDTTRKFKDSGIRIIGWLDSDDLAAQKKINPINESYEDFHHKNDIDSIVIAYQGNESPKAHHFIAKHYNDLVPIQLLPDITYSMIGHQIEDFGGIPTLHVNKPTQSSVQLFLKHLSDLILTIIGVVLISPLLVFIAIGVKLSSKGPILFGQERVGLNGKTFLMWKFRSMRVADDEKSTQEWSKKENPRKTKFGDFLRRSSLDELPQLFNVLIGNMSLIGPRPEQPFFVEKFRHEIPGYMLKHRMKPGMSGWAQINGWRGDTSISKRIECDIYYIKNWSLWLDLKILFLTIFKGFFNKNAY